jgi:hypothetical protein
MNTIQTADQARTEIIARLESNIAAMRARLETATEAETVIQIEGVFVAWKDGAVSPTGGGIMHAHIMTAGEAENLYRKVQNGNGKRGLPLSLPFALRQEIENTQTIIESIRAA